MFCDATMFGPGTFLLLPLGMTIIDQAVRVYTQKVFPPGIVKADCFRIRPSRSVDSRFLMEILNSRGASSQIRRLAQGVTRDRANLSQLRRIVLKIPPLEEQRRIAAILDTFDETVRANEQQRDKLWRLRSGLAADLLSGRVRTVAA